MLIVACQASTDPSCATLTKVWLASGASAWCSAVEVQPWFLELLPSLGAVWVGMSAGSMVMAPSVGEDFIQWRPPVGDVSTLGLVDFSICPHVNGEGVPGNTMAEAESWAATIDGPAYAVDDQTAFSVVDGEIEVISEGHWTQFPR